MTATSRLPRGYDDVIDQLLDAAPRALRLVWIFSAR
jgi:hypothetical protein